MLVALLLACCAVAAIPTADSPDRTTWLVVLAVQAVPYACSLLVSLVSALDLPSRLVGTGYREMERACGAAVEARAARQPPTAAAPQ